MQKLQKLIDRIRLPASLEWLRQFLKFTIMGTVSTAIELSVYYLCLKLFSWNYQASNAVSVFISTVNAYIWSHMFVFGNGEKLSFLKHMVRFLKTSATYGITFLLGIVLLWTAVEKLTVVFSYAVAPSR